VRLLTEDRRDKSHHPPGDPQRRGRRICYGVQGAGRFFVSLQYQIAVEISPTVKDLKPVLGLDYKSDGLYVDSEGNKANMPRYYHDAQRQLDALRWSKQEAPHFKRYA
jgi:hypothetical protein